MSQRTNAGYIITDSVHVGDTEFVLGVSQHIPNDFVTWRCSNGNYYWGHYHSNLFSAQNDLVERAAERVAEIQEVLEAKMVVEPGFSPGGKFRAATRFAMVFSLSAQRAMAASWCIKSSQTMFYPAPR